MSLRIQDIIRNPNLRTRFLAGQGGSDRLVEWAHATEVDRPWEWLGTGELFMTLGRNFPVSPGDQQSFIRACSQAELSGIDLAEGWFAPKLTVEAVQLADQLDFPIIETSYEVPFSSLTKAVADSSQRSRNTSEVMQVYECYRNSIMSQRSETETLVDLALHMRASYSIVRLDSGSTILCTHDEPPKDVVSKIRRLNRSGPLPAVNRIINDGQTYLIMPIHGRELALVTCESESRMDLVVMQHAGALASLIVNLFMNNLNNSVSYDGLLLRQLMDGSIDLELGRARLLELGMETGPWRVASCADTEKIDVVSLYVNSLKSGIKGIATITDSGCFILLSGEVQMDRSWLSVMGMPQSVIGVSQEFFSLSRLIDATRESVWARNSNVNIPGTISIYGESQTPFFPRTLAEAEKTVDRVLGAVIAYDCEHDAQLVHSLRVFFESRKSWQIASKQLGIHRQTLVYRLQRIAELTDRDLRTVKDTAELYMALQAMESIV